MSSRGAGICRSIHVLALTLWITSLGAAGVTAGFVFATLPDLGVSLRDYAAYQPGDPRAHGLLASGIVLEKVFTASAFAQMALAPIAIVTIIVELWRRDRRPGRASSIVRCGCIGVASLLLAWQVVILAPRFNSHLREYWDAAKAGDHPAAALHHASMDGIHPTMQRILEAQFVLLLIAVAGGASSRSGPSNASSLQPPRLLVR